jgi:hypothetical protein
MDFRSLRRDPQSVYASRAVLSDGEVITKTGCKIYVPVRFEDKKLVSISTDIFIVGIYLMVLPDGACAVSLINAMIGITPSRTNTVKIDGERYYEFEFDKGARVYKDTELVMDNKLVYKIYNEIFSQGYIPAYLNYNDLAKLFDSAKAHSGTNVGEQNEVIELIVSIIGRNAKDKTQYYREVITKLGDLLTNPPAFISLRDVSYAPSNTLDRLAGSYMEAGVIAALARPSERVERIEGILRA